MKVLKAFQRTVAVYATVLAISAISANGQISSPCTSSMIATFTPCLNFVTGSTGNGSSPTSECCAALKSLMSNSVDCGCLVVTGSVPFQLPLIQTLIISLPRACNMDGVSAQCHATGTPLPAPGPVLLGPSPPPPLAASPLLPPPLAASPLSPRASKAAATAQAPTPESGTTIELSPASPPVDSEAPKTSAKTSPGIRPVITPSAANPSRVSSPLLLFLALGIAVFKCY